MSRIFTRDFLIEVQKGTVAGHAIVHKFGRNIAVPNGSWAFISLLGHTSWPLSAATTVRIKAGGNANDTAAGTGAREVVVEGIDSNLAELSEAIATAGASASSNTTASFWRVHRAWVSSGGTYGGSNTAAITIENSGGGTDLIQIPTGGGQSQFGAWTVPTGKTAYPLGIHIHVDSNKTGNIRLCTREDMNDTTAPVKPVRVKLFFDGVTNDEDFSPRSPGLAVAALTDIWAEAYGDGAIIEVSVDIELLVVDN